MRERIPCEFFLIRYVPDAVRNEFVNIGVLLRDGTGGNGQRPVVRFTRDWSRVRCMDPDADTAMLEALEGELQIRLLEQQQTGVKPLMELLEDSFSNTLQITDAKGCLAETVISEVESLMSVYVEPRKRKGASRKTGRTAIQNSIRTQFERANVWHLMQKRIPASLYTRQGDPLRLDCAYRPNGVIKMFHAVSLESDVELAKVLAFSAPALREGVARVEDAKLELTAVIEPLAFLREKDEDEDQIAQYRFAVETMEMQAIRVMTTNDLPRMAETAKRDLRVE